jgi:predicted transcriptional regulator
MKRTIEISDDLFARAQRLARKEKTPFRALTEAGAAYCAQGEAFQNPEVEVEAHDLSRRRLDR